jgi:cob(I)alamin adenosyltransferase
VALAQFLKGRETGEVLALEAFGERLLHRQFGEKDFFMPGSADRKRHREKSLEGLAWASSLMDEGIRLLVLDEVVTALDLGLVERGELEEVLDRRPAEMELVLTGRGMPDWLYRKSDLVTEMRSRKHYYKKGVNARQGIEF